MLLPISGRVWIIQSRVLGQLARYLGKINNKPDPNLTQTPNELKV